MRNFSNEEPRRRSKSRISKIWKSKLTSILSTISGTALTTPRYSRMCPKGQLFTLPPSAPVLLRGLRRCPPPPSSLISSQFHPGFKISAAYRRNFGVFFVFGLHRFLVFRCFSEFFVPNLKNFKKFINNH